MPFDKEYKDKLDANIKKMLEGGASNEEVVAYSNDFKTKYLKKKESTPSPSPLVSGTSNVAGGASASHQPDVNQEEPDYDPSKPWDKQNSPDKPLDNMATFVDSAPTLNGVAQTSPFGKVGVPSPVVPDKTLQIPQQNTDLLRAAPSTGETTPKDITNFSPEVQQTGLKMNPYSEALMAGTASLVSGVLKSPALAWDMIANAKNKMSYNPGKTSEEQSSIPTSEEISQKTGLSNTVAEGLDKATQSYAEDKAARYDKGVTDYIKNGEYKKAFGLLSESALESMPATLAIMTGNVAGAGGLETTLAGGFVFGANEKTKLQQEHPEMSDDDINKVAFSKGLFEGTFEQFGLGKLGTIAKSIFEKQGAEAAKKIAKEGFLSTYGPALKRYFGVQGEEMLSEAATQFADNVVDKYGGVNPDLDLKEGLSDAAIQAFFQGGIMTAAVTAADVVKTRKNLKQAVKIDEQKKALTEDLQSDNVSDDVKPAISKKIQDLNEQEANLYSEEKKVFESLPNEKKAEVNDLLKESKRIADAATNETISEPTKEILKKDLDEVDKKIDGIFEEGAKAKEESMAAEAKAQDEDNQSEIDYFNELKNSGIDLTPEEEARLNELLPKNQPAVEETPATELGVVKGENKSEPIELNPTIEEAPQPQETLPPVSEEVVTENKSPDGGTQEVTTPVEATVQETPIKDKWNERVLSIDTEKSYTDLSELKVGDVLVTKTGSLGFVKKINPKKIIIETTYGGYGNNDATMQDLSVDKTEVAQFKKPKVESPEKPVSKESLPTEKPETAKKVEERRNVDAPLLAKSLGEALAKTVDDYKSNQELLVALENKYFEDNGLTKESFDKLNDEEKSKIIKDAVEWKKNNPDIVSEVKKSISEKYPKATEPLVADKQDDEESVSKLNKDIEAMKQMKTQDLAEKKFVGMVERAYKMKEEGKISRPTYTEYKNKAKDILEGKVKSSQSIGAIEAKIISTEAINKVREKLLGQGYKKITLSSVSPITPKNIDDLLTLANNIIHRGIDAGFTIAEATQKAIKAIRLHPAYKKLVAAKQIDEKEFEKALSSVENEVSKQEPEEDKKPEPKTEKEGLNKAASEGDVTGEKRKKKTAARVEARPDYKGVLSKIDKDELFYASIDAKKAVAHINDMVREFEKQGLLESLAEDMANGNNPFNEKIKNLAAAAVVDRLRVIAQQSGNEFQKDYFESLAGKVQVQRMKDVNVAATQTGLESEVAKHMPLSEEGLKEWANKSMAEVQDTYMDDKQKSDVQEAQKSVAEIMASEEGQKAIKEAVEAEINKIAEETKGKDWADKVKQKASKLKIDLTDC